MRKAVSPPCDKDCKHCKFPDCVWDGLDYDDYKEQAQRDRELTSTPERVKWAAQKRAYREAKRKGEKI